MPEAPTTVGRYHIERLIAHGGMGSLYLARDPVIDRLVAIKLLREGFDDAAARERFAREARSAGRLHHPNIVTVFDVGEHHDRPFIAMEYVAGETLAQLIKRRAIGRRWQMLVILEDLCAALHYAHSAGIVHRDIKPANVMLDESGLVKILDFGIARAGGIGITQAGDLVGTLNYMSPEQLAGQEVDHRTDIYSVGALAYELVTTQMAFPGTIQTGVLHRILNGSPLPIATLVPGIDPEIPGMIERAMAKAPEARYQDLESLRQDLAAVRTRLLEMSSETEAEDPEAETRFQSVAVASGAPPVHRRACGRRCRQVREPAPYALQHRTRSRRVALGRSSSRPRPVSWPSAWPLSGRLLDQPTTDRSRTRPQRNGPSPKRRRLRPRLRRLFRRPPRQLPGQRSRPTAWRSKNSCAPCTPARANRSPLEIVRPRSKR